MLVLSCSQIIYHKCLTKVNRKYKSVLCSLISVGNDCFLFQKKKYCRYPSFFLKFFLNLCVAYVGRYWFLSYSITVVALLRYLLFIFFTQAELHKSLCMNTGVYVMMFIYWIAILEPVAQYFALWNENSRCHIVIFLCCNCSSKCSCNCIFMGQLYSAVSFNLLCVPL